jgi:hypothetical protein
MVAVAVGWIVLCVLVLLLSLDDKVAAFQLAPTRVSMVLAARAHRFEKPVSVMTLSVSYSYN